ncbi:general substrate transporter [Lipomyces starkeyi]
MVRVLNVYTISVFVALGGALFGLDLASMSAILGTDQYKNYFGNPLGTRQGAITSAMAAGSFFGALSSSFLGDQFSRKVAIQVGALLWCIGSVVQSTSNGVAMLIAGRVISGLCIGVTSSLVPIYQSEIAPRKIRGRILSIQQYALSWGFMLQYFVQYGCSFINSQAAFRLPWATQAIPAIILFIGLFWFPRSPRWLASKDRWSESLHVIAFLRTANSDINNPLVLAEYKEIEDQIRLERDQESNSFRELFSPKMRNRVFLSMAIQVWSQLCGVNMLTYYVVYIFQSAGIKNYLLASAVEYVTFLVVPIPTILWTDRWGRRPSLLLGAIFLAFWLFLIGGLLMSYGEPTSDPNQPFTWVIVDHPAVSRTILACSYLSLSTFALSWGPVSWMYPPEIIPLRIRAKSVSLATASNWAVNFALGFAVPSLLRSTRWRIFFIFGCFNIAAFIHVLVAAPEMKQRTLEEMDEVFEYREPLWKTFTGGRVSSRLEELAKDIEMSQLRRQG